MKIRPCKIDDLLRCEELCNIPELYFANGGHFLTSDLEARLDEKYFLVSEINNKVIGLVFGEEVKCNGFMVWVIVVDKDYRGKKVGEKLLKQIEKNAKKEGRSWVVLYASTKSKKTVNFYRNQKYNIGQKCIECAKEI
ncbi:MAG TPA: GNAT family N-acetyltransferase [bacterium]|nr:GNAT family N-acetyltransferase [bacterium]